jgi:hypothetical protein
VTTCHSKNKGINGNEEALQIFLSLEIKKLNFCVIISNTLVRKENIFIFWNQNPTVSTV